MIGTLILLDNPDVEPWVTKQLSDLDEAKLVPRAICSIRPRPTTMARDYGSTGEPPPNFNFMCKVKLDHVGAYHGMYEGIPFAINENEHTDSLIIVYE
jgi:hypothetical protein